MPVIEGVVFDDGEEGSDCDHHDDGNEGPVIKTLK